MHTHPRAHTHIHGHIRHKIYRFRPANIYWIFLSLSLSFAIITNNCLCQFVVHFSLAVGYHTSDKICIRIECYHFKTYQKTNMHASQLIGRKSTEKNKQSKKTRRKCEKMEINNKWMELDYALLRLWRLIDPNRVGFFSMLVYLLGGWYNCSQFFIIIWLI